MRYTIDEVLSGMFASIEQDTFTDDPERLGEAFKELSRQASIFAPFAALVGEADFSAVLEGTLQSLVSDGHLEHQPAATICRNPVGPAASLVNGRCSIPAISRIWRQAPATLTPNAAR
jgi:hypothetical protein